MVPTFICLESYLGEPICLKPSQYEGTTRKSPAKAFGPMVEAIT